MEAQVVEDSDSEKRRAPTTLPKFLRHQANNTFAIQAVEIVDQENAELIVNENVLIVQIAVTHGAKQVVVPRALRSHLQCHTH